MIAIVAHKEGLVPDIGDHDHGVFSNIWTYVLIK
jgi:hypothetical protein